MTTMKNIGKYYMDSAEFLFENLDEMIVFLKEREKTGKWYTDEDNCRVDGIRFKPVFPEPICVPAEVNTLKQSKTAIFTASEEAYADTMLCEGQGYYGSTQMMMIGQHIYPVGKSAVRGVLDRAGLGSEGYEKLRRVNPNGLSDVLNILFKATDKYATVLVQDEKIRAINSYKYAICPASFVAETTRDWIQNKYPKAEFITGYWNHDFAEWQINLKEYRNDIFGQFPELLNSGFEPAIIIRMSNTGKNAVSLRTALIRNELIFPLFSSVNAVHVAQGKNATERTLQIKSTVRKNFDEIFSSIKKGMEEIEKLRKINVNNAYNAVLRAMKSLKVPKEQGMEAAHDFKVMFGDGPATGYDCFLTLVDAYAFTVRDFPNNYCKQFEVADIVSKADKIKWDKLGDIPGDFSW